MASIVSSYISTEPTIPSRRPIFLYFSLSQEAEALAKVQRLYATLLDRAPNSVESQTWLQYYTTSGLNTTALAKSILSSTEFSQKYGSLTNAEFVEQIYQNALGRDATMAELSSWLTQLSAGTATQAGVAEAVSESAEHIADGNVYQVTNNTYNTSGTYTLDHTTDTAVVDAVVNNLYETALARAADASGLSTYSAAILNGTMTETQIAAALISSAEFLSKYGSMTNAEFVNQVFLNGLGRQPTSAKSSYWTGELSSGAISEADFVAAIAQSPDHLQTVNSTVYTVPYQPITVSSSGQTVTTLPGNTVVFGAGLSDTVTGSGATLDVTTGDVITMGAGASATISGSGATLNAASGNTVIFAVGAWDTVSGSGATVDIATGDVITASNDIIAFLPGTAATVTGTGNTIALVSGNTLTLSASSIDTINGSGATINAATGDVLTVSNSTVNFGASATATITGSGNTISAANGDKLTASNDTITIGAGTSRAAASATVTGSGNTINAATYDSLTASGDTVNLAASATDTLTGNSNTINVGKTDTLTVSGSSDAFVFVPAFGVDTINGFASTDQATFSVSDFANWSALLSHTTQSGSNTVITLDASDKITLTGVTASSLQSSQFHFQ